MPAPGDSMDDPQAVNALRMMLTTPNTEDHAQQQEPTNDSNGSFAGSAPPPFLTKTYEMVDDSNTDHIVRWSGQNSFVVLDPGKFSVTVLPCYFKHNNLSSFVRQLNIYGFRKVNSESWEFSNPSFERGNSGRLREIKRRKTVPKDEKDLSEPEPAVRAPSLPTGYFAQPPNAPEGMKLPLGFSPNQEQALLDNQQTLINQVCRLRQEHEAMQRVLSATINELHETRCHQHRTQDTVEKIMGFLSSVLKTNSSAMSSAMNGTVLGKRKLPQYQLEAPPCIEQPPEVCNTVGAALRLVPGVGCCECAAFRGPDRRDALRDHVHGQPARRRDHGACASHTASTRAAAGGTNPGPTE
eukprot:TRINITY_DN228_c0_g1_i3.p1 TRINITY_DN228_c0_g1~~TRINITY_DN228_c0_g1_i3.p1  ORF type:complete len:354 (+),score=81.05 TRINITY_DN228_c0_g1_i3:94-1155(+)